MSRQQSYRSEKGRRDHSPQYNRYYDRRDSEISQAETSVEYHRGSRDFDHSRYDRKRSSSRKSDRKSHNKSKYRDHHRKRSPKRSHRRSRSFEVPKYQSHQSSKSRVIFDREKIERFGSNKREKDDFRPKQRRDSQKSERVDEISRIMDDIQRFSYERLNYEELKEKFVQTCNQNLKFVSVFPEACTFIGQQLLKDGNIFFIFSGLFHQMWSLALLKCKEAPMETLVQNYYVLFKSIVSKNLTNFERTFNPIPEEEKSFHREYSSRKNDYRNYDENTRSTTKMDVMLLYEQVKGDMRVAEIEENLVKKFEESFEQLKSKMDQKFILQNQNPSDQWFDDDKAIANWTKKEDQQRQSSIEKIKKQKIHERSPLSNRFRIMHEVQSNQRRMAIEMACVFLKLGVFYFFNDLHIVKVDQVIMSENQEIIVVKAYSVDFCPLMGKMKIEPKLKNLIAVYKFSSLQELVRLENTHGKFDGIIVYPESFNAQRYLTTSDEISLLKGECIEQIKEQIKQQVPEESHQY